MSTAAFYLKKLERYFETNVASLQQMNLIYELPFWLSLLLSSLKLCTILRVFLAIRTVMKDILRGGSMRRNTDCRKERATLIIHMHVPEEKASSSNGVYLF